jgi:hypothetical protein
MKLFSFFRRSTATFSGSITLMNLIYGMVGLRFLKVNFLFKSSELLFVIILLLGKQVGFPFPERLKAEVIDLKSLFILFIFSNRVVYKFNHSHFSLVVISATEIFNTGETTFKVFKSRRNLMVETLHSFSIKKSLVDELVSV